MSVKYTSTLGPTAGTVNDTYFHVPSIVGCGRCKDKWTEATGRGRRQTDARGRMFMFCLFVCHMSCRADKGPITGKARGAGAAES